MANRPQTRHEMRRAGYKLLSVAECRGCDATVEWWETTNGRKMPFDPAPDDHAQVTTHFVTCPKADEFRGRSQPASAPPAKPKATGMPSIGLATFQRELQSLMERAGARAAVLAYEDGQIASWRHGIPAEDLRHELITAANFVRNSIAKGSH